MLRRERGWSQEDLAEASGLHRTYVGGIERAERNCTLDVLASLAGALEVPLAELLVQSRTETPDEVREGAATYRSNAPSSRPQAGPLSRRHRSVSITRRVLQRANLRARSRTQKGHTSGGAGREARFAS